MLTFVCTACRSAGTAPDRDAKLGCHERCKGGTWCDCQHRVTQRHITR